MEKNALIYGVKTKNKYHYIGKTNKKVIVNGEISNSKINAQYKNKPLTIRKIHLTPVGAVSTNEA